MSDDEPQGVVAAGFTVGQVVAVRADRSRQGPVVAVLPGAGGQTRYRVFHSAGTTREYAEDQLVPVEPLDEDRWARDLAGGAWSDPESFRSRLTATRLANPQIDHIYALQAARIQFIPFQFKPLLRLLRADRPRLLIADDVGVGKTIEAGLILKELSTRQRLDRVLVVCPKALTVKWRAEMRRFDEEFRILDARSLRYCLDEADLEGAWPAEYSRSIVHYELMRMETYLYGREGVRRHPGLLELDSSPQFDLVIADEAHHLRTPGTRTHQMMEHLCDVAEAVLMLSATPVQTSADNLFALLSLLRPDLFPDVVSFREVTEPNRHITAAITALRQGPASGEDWLDRIRDALDTAADTTWGRSALRSDPTFGRVSSTVAALALSDEARVRCIRDLEEVHPLAHVMNRTRRRDIGRFTIREPHTVSVPFTPEQEELYRQVVEFRRNVLLLDYPPIVVNLILTTLERQAASSITALAENIEDVLGSNGFRVSEITDDPEIDESPDAEIDLRPHAAALLSRARALPSADPKFDRLLTLVHDTLGQEDAPGKVLVFSFFLRTLDYMRRRLVAAGVRVGVITGETPDDDREELRDRFRLDRTDPQALDVLLSSEVGCEGLDYEFCDRLVNYDIPWNPMRLEQRIGRIDRFGQTSDKVLIFNFVTPGTVEERVFVRCYERLGIFRDTVGDLEEVLGPIVQQLTHIALDRALTPAQAEEMARQVADNALRRAEEQRRLDDETASLMGLDDAFTEEVDVVVDRGRWVRPADIEVLVAAFLTQPDVSGTLARHDGEVRTIRTSAAGRSRLVSILRSLPNDRAKLAFVRQLESGEPVVLTFDQETALARRSVDFVTPVHPLAKAAVSYWLDIDDPLITGLQLRCPSVTPGQYVFACERWETISARPDLRLVCLAVALDDGRLEDRLARELLTVLGSAEPANDESLVQHEGVIGECLDELVHHSEALRRQAVDELLHANNTLIDRRLASLHSYYDNRVRRVRAEHDAATEARIVRMKAAELARVEHEHRERADALERAREVEILSERVAVGYVEVVPDAG